MFVKIFSIEGRLIGTEIVVVEILEGACSIGSSSTLFFESKMIGGQPDCPLSPFLLPVPSKTLKDIRPKL